MFNPYMALRDPNAEMTLYEKALGVATSMVMDGPDGSIMLAEMLIQDSTFILSAERPSMAEAPSGRSPLNLLLYITNVDEALKPAAEAGMSIESEPENMFWGYRST